jgi:hypothetical protein
LAEAVEGVGDGSGGEFFVGVVVEEFVEGPDDEDVDLLGFDADGEVVLDVVIGELEGVAKNA